MRWRIRLLNLLFSYCLMVSTSLADIRVGTLFFYPPFVLSNDSGFDIQLIKTICQNINQKCIMVPMDYYSLFSALNTGKIDIAVGGITISKKLKETYIFSLPYMLSKGQFIVQKGSAYKSVNDLKGKTVGILMTEEKQGAYYNYLLENFPGLFVIQQFDDIEDLMTSLNENEISAAFLNYLSASYWVMSSASQLQNLDAATPLGEGIGIMSIPNNANLIDEINGQLLQMEKDGSYLKLYNMYIPTF
ncbi:arginine-binding periplasmic protein [Legionella beliardensis]|uniref:Arginine-binding periplasmic protein n=1 Tax=Legionella beliardensis TaxID=91822 RepID=A0A378I219_9GAMM|nr:transporter substrate-binding domain-containing protein [Legionella beliardensis]STX28770.1 arginine-binding periplasmic protein [Legionella beliardensis]